MKVAVVGSRSLTVNNLEKYLPPDTSEVISGGAKGIDTCAKNYANKNGLKLTEFFPNYNKYGRKAPLYRNLQIINHADYVIVFWDGISHGTKFVIDYCRKLRKPIKLFMPTKS